jgi:hypothetical protein
VKGKKTQKNKERKQGPFLKEISARVKNDCHLDIIHVHKTNSEGHVNKHSIVDTQLTMCIKIVHYESTRLQNSPCKFGSPLKFGVII